MPGRRSPARTAPARRRPRRTGSVPRRRCSAGPDGATRTAGSLRRCRSAASGCRSARRPARWRTRAAGGLPRGPGSGPRRSAGVWTPQRKHRTPGRAPRHVLPSPSLWCRHGYLHVIRTGSLRVKVAVRVLIVDDLVPFRRVARAVIDASDGFVAVGEAGSGEEAVLAAGLLRPDLVLMDVNLPGIDGIEATRRIRSQSRSGAPVVLLLSTWEQDDGCGGQ